MKNIYTLGNLIWIRIDRNDTYGSKSNQYMLCGRTGGLSPDVILTTDELNIYYPSGKWLEYINPSDTAIFNNI